MKRRLAVAVVAILALAVVYLLVLRDTTVSPRVSSAQPTSAIGTGSDAVGVSADGAILFWLPVPTDSSLPLLPLDKAPESGQLKGTALQQARVLGAAPAALRPYVQSSYFGESGVDVVLKAGIELRFGDASQAARKWRVAAAILADSSVTALDYVNVIAPSRPTTGGSGHTLPTLP